MNSCSLGIIVHNEEKNIGKLLRIIDLIKLSDWDIREIIVVASGCTDRTVEIVKEYCRGEMGNGKWEIGNEKSVVKEYCGGNVRLFVEGERRGKASGINIFLANTVSDVLIMQSGDTIAKENTYRMILEQFKDDKIGVVGVRVVPINSKSNFMGFTANFLWDVHHLIASEHPKCGELIGFRNVISSIPEDTVVDEPQIEMMVREKGFITKYLSEAIVYNKGPNSVKEFLMRRRNIVAGYIKLSRRSKNSFPSINKLRLLRYAITYPDKSKREFVWVLGAIFLEMTARILGIFDYYFCAKSLNIWDIAESTKGLDYN